MNKRRLAFAANAVLRHFNLKIGRRDDGGLWSAYTRDALALAAATDCTLEALHSPQQHPERVKHADQVCNWYLPVFDRPTYGGIMTALRLAAYLRDEYQVESRFLLCGPCDTNAIRNSIGRVFSSLATCQVISLDSAASIQAIPQSDYSIATLWTTAYVLLNVNNTGLKLYLIQDYEPDFYPAGSTSAQAELTYTFGFHAIANTQTLARMYRETYGGRSIALVPSVDTDVFFSRGLDRPANGPFRLFYYARPGTPRNGFELAVAAFKILKRSLGDRIEIICAGADWRPEQYGLGGVVTTIGMLPYEETGALYRSCHAGLTMMMSRHPSYLPFELMACGTLVIANRNPWNLWLLKNGENCLLAPPTATAIAQTIERAIAQYESLAEVRARALRLIHENHSDWNGSLKSVADYMRSLGNEAEGDRA